MRTIRTCLGIALLSVTALAGNSWECDPTQGSTCTAKWRQPDGSWVQKTYNSGDVVVIGDDDSVTLQGGNWSQVGI